MKKNNSRPEYSIINIRVLVLIYILLCILTIIFSGIFFSNILQDGKVPDRLNMIVFFTIPSVLVIIFLISTFNLLRDIISRRPGSKFNSRLLAYFIIIVVFSTAPVIIITISTINETIRFWQSINTVSAARAADSFIADNYLLHLERFEKILWETDFTRNQEREDIAAVQVFRFNDTVWAETSFTGNEKYALPSPPMYENGFSVREFPRDTGVIRYVQKHGLNTIYVINYRLGEDFDAGKLAIKNQTEKFETIDLLKANLRALIIYFYGVFFLPTLLMTIIIAISFTRRITQPIVELTEATRRVAEGDFSIQILSHRNDELGLLIRSFNAMVQDIERSRAALVKNETISLWQNMAQQLAHEIKNPLTPIKLSAERVLRRWRNDPENIKEIIENSMLAILQETEGLSTLLNEFKTLSKPMEPSKVWTQVKAPFEEIISTYSSSYPEVSFDIDHVKEDFQIKMDKHRLLQILTNLIINAIDAMNGTGIIDIRTDIVKKHDICYCRFSIKDNGKGIGERERPLIFTPYFTTKDSGTGLGLPIVERIVNDHGGSIWFDSTEGMGAIFYIDLPCQLEEKPVD